MKRSGWIRVVWGAGLLATVARGAPIGDVLDVVAGARQATVRAEGGWVRVEFPGTNTVHIRPARRPPRRDPIHVTIRKPAAASEAMPIRSAGRLTGECSIPGETRADELFPAHPHRLQLGCESFPDNTNLRSDSP